MEGLPSRWRGREWDKCWRTRLGEHVRRKVQEGTQSVLNVEASRGVGSPRCRGVPADVHSRGFCRGRGVARELAQGWGSGVQDQRQGGGQTPKEQPQAPSHHSHTCTVTHAHTHTHSPSPPGTSSWHKFSCSEPAPTSCHLSPCPRCQPEWGVPCGCPRLRGRRDLGPALQSTWPPTQVGNQSGWVLRLGEQPQEMSWQSGWFADLLEGRA